MNCFLTLTYNDENLPKNHGLQIRDTQLFFKRLRKMGFKFRYYCAGEYGELYHRPHYHICMFGFYPPDAVLWTIKNGVKLYRSLLLEKIWEKGFITVGNVTYESASYVAQYVTKKITGEKADEHYKGRQPEFATMSRRPGLGRGWIEKNHEDVYTTDVLVYTTFKGQNRVTRPPKYYDKIYDEYNPSHFKKILTRRLQHYEKSKIILTPLRIKSITESKLLKIKSKKTL